MRWALYKNGKRIGPVRDSQWTAAKDAESHDGVASIRTDYGLETFLHFKDGFEVRKHEEG